MAVDLEKSQDPEAEPLRAFAMPDLSLYVRGGGSTVRALGTGSATLGRRLWNACRAPRLIALVRASGIVSWGGAFCTACGAVATWKVIGPYISLVATGAVALWAVAALMHSRPSKALPEEAEEAASEGEEQPEVEADEDTAQRSPEESRAAFHAFVREAIGDRTGVHLAELLACLREHRPLDGWEVAHMRALCESHGVPVSRAVRVGRQVTVGVRKADLQPHSPEEVQEPAEAA